MSMDKIDARIANTCERLGVTPAELAEKSDAEILKIVSFGALSLQRLRELHGYPNNGWYTIDTLPTNGDHVLLYAQGSQTVAQINAKKTAMTLDGKRVTHWRPLIAGPR